MRIRRKYKRTIDAIFQRPASGNINWRDIEQLFYALGAKIEEREGSRILVRLFDERRVFHRPHPTPFTDKAAIESIRKWLFDNGVMP